jgi:hypothetical protein
VAGKFDYADVNDADAHAVSELQVGVKRRDAVGHVMYNAHLSSGARQLGGRAAHASSYSSNPRGCSECNLTLIQKNETSDPARLNRCRPCGCSRKSFSCSFCSRANCA